MFKKLRYEWHLKRAERINALLRSQAYATGDEVRELTNLRYAHIHAMAKLKETTDV